MKKLVTTERRQDGNRCWGPFDAAPCEGAALDDLDPEWMTLFVRIARRARKFPLPEDVPPEGLLKHLNLLNKGRLTNAAVLLFGKSPQRFLISSEIKCAHFHGTEVEKPIPSYQVYKGTVFQLVDQAVDFVLGKIDRRVGTRSESARAPRTYEIPPEVVTEAVVNAVAHRDYTSNGSVQVMLFSDRLEVRNPGRLAPPLTLEDLRVAHNSAPGKPLAGGALVPRRIRRTHGNGDAGHDPPVRRGGPPGAGVRRHRWIRDDRSAGSAAGPSRGPSKQGAKKGPSRSRLRAKQGAKKAMPRAKRRPSRAMSRAKRRAKQGPSRAKTRAKRYCRPRTPPCCEPAAGRPFPVKICRQPRAIRVGRAISEDGWSGS